MLRVYDLQERFGHLCVRLSKRCVASSFRQKQVLWPPEGVRSSGMVLYVTAIVAVMLGLTLPFWRRRNTRTHLTESRIKGSEKGDGKWSKCGSLSLLQQRALQEKRDSFGKSVVYVACKWPEMYT